MKKKIFSHFVYVRFLIGVNIIGLPLEHVHTITINQLTTF
jgi:hypothetical protein